MLARVYARKVGWPILPLPVPVALLGVVLLCVAVGQLLPRPAVPSTNKINLGQFPLSFEPNAGQADPEVRFTTRGSGGTFYFTPSEVVLALAAPRPDAGCGAGNANCLSRSRYSAGSSDSRDSSVAHSVVRLQFMGAN